MTEPTFNVGDRIRLRIAFDEDGTSERGQVVAPLDAEGDVWVVLDGDDPSDEDFWRPYPPDWMETDPVA